MDNITISGLALTPLKIIETELGAVLHGMKKNDPGFVDFGEAYFSVVKNNTVKGWKKHHQMTLNLVVPAGKIKFVAYDDRADSPTNGCIFEVELSRSNYQRLTVPPGIWLAFQGQADPDSMLLNLASIPHDPGEVDTLPIDTKKIPYRF